MWYSGRDFVAEKVSLSGVSCQQCPFKEGALHSMHQKQALPYGCGVPLDRVSGHGLAPLAVLCDVGFFPICFL